MRGADCHEWRGSLNPVLAQIRGSQPQLPDTVLVFYSSRLRSQVDIVQHILVIILIDGDKSKSDSKHQ